MKLLTLVGRKAGLISGDSDKLALRSKMTEHLINKLTFYSLKESLQSRKHPRIHHSISTDKAAPDIFPSLTSQFPLKTSLPTASSDVLLTTTFCSEHFFVAAGRISQFLWVTSSRASLYQQHWFVWVSVCLAALQPHQLFWLNLLVSLWANSSQEACRKSSSYWERDSAKKFLETFFRTGLEEGKENGQERQNHVSHQKSLKTFVPLWKSQPSKFGWCVELTRDDIDCCSIFPENTQLNEAAKATKRPFYVLTWSSKALDQKPAQTIRTPVLLFGHCPFPTPAHSPCFPCWKKDSLLANVKSFWKRFGSCFPR